MCHGVGCNWHICKLVFAVVTWISDVGDAIICARLKAFKCTVIVKELFVYLLELEFSRFGDRSKNRL